MTPIELYRKGFKALVDALGYADAIRFIRQFDSGSGNYTSKQPRTLRDGALVQFKVFVGNRQS
ncbi:hypothetical protein WA1_00190 [Scytonema hofmannii PCC 7110]|uniref:Uncharacterized protein n=1 Tax=Scytonema hofmannii PCC 7110 TaxID=128403 RepID=A0A139XG31_9CYAN|nr:hypothetical protein [Scytonema hofmannii]KYC43629.1 hypothetical protein WA1_00190 [Scytonema hofmannii PCC 7110]